MDNYQVRCILSYLRDLSNTNPSQDNSVSLVDYTDPAAEWFKAHEKNINAIALKALEAQQQWEQLFTSDKSSPQGLDTIKQAEAYIAESKDQIIHLWREKNTYDIKAAEEMEKFKSAQTEADCDRATKDMLGARKRFMAASKTARDGLSEIIAAFRMRRSNVSPKRLRDNSHYENEPGPQRRRGTTTPVAIPTGPRAHGRQSPPSSIQSVCLPNI
jgi:hypothetical protein